MHSSLPYKNERLRHSIYLLLQHQPRSLRLRDSIITLVPLRFFFKPIMMMNRYYERCGIPTNPFFDPSPRQNPFNPPGGEGLRRVGTLDRPYKKPDFCGPHFQHNPFAPPGGYPTGLRRVGTLERPNIRPHCFDPPPYQYSMDTNELFDCAGSHNPSIYPRSPWGGYFEINRRT